MNQMDFMPDDYIVGVIYFIDVAEKKRTETKQSFSYHNLFGFQ